MNYKQRKLRLKRLNERKKLYRKTGFHSLKALGYDNLKRKKRYEEVSYE